MYCNYSKSKFRNELTFIIPSWLNIPELEINNNLHVIMDNYKVNYAVREYLVTLSQCQGTYLNLLANSWTPQQARQVLPNALKAEINMCGFVPDWRHFFELRDNSHAHPDMQALVKPLHQEFKDRNYV